MLQKVCHIIVLIWVLLGTGIACAQYPELNKKYMVNNTYSIGNLIMHSDSAYITTGISLDTNSLNWQGVFARYDLEGNEEWRLTLSDTGDYYYWEWPSLIQTLDSNYAVLGSYSRYYHFTKFTPEGDTLFNNTIDDFWYNDNMNRINPGEIIQVDEDSSYYSSVFVQSASGGGGVTAFFRMDKYGNMMNYTYLPPSGQFYATIHGSFCQVDDTTFAVSLFETSPSNVPLENSVNRSVIVFLDTLGNEYYRWTDTQNDYSSRIKGLFPTAEGGLIFTRLNGTYYSATNSVRYRGNVVRLDENFQEEWSVTFGKEWPFGGVEIMDAVMLEDSSVVVAGTQMSGLINGNAFQTYGWLVKVDKNGEVVWERKFYNISHTEDPLNNYHRIMALDTTPDGGFVGVGEARNGTDVMNGIPGQFGWLVKTDSLGCIVPGCQFADVKEPEEERALTIYPNPVQEQLNIFYAGGQEGTLKLTSLEGKILRKTQISGEAVTYMMPVADLSAGIYLVVLENKSGEVVLTKKIIKQ